eukprot:TRINITY_DN15908_c0_g1_i1.p2 TRINITY_DN15908_c0_g1~~TRINITY_DN15908_c0_g1_i1.p2  ORF type:complete len:171 (+),score=39.36 TRINITY_DN15908_c0_g1_i1:668-1180(+)
MKRKTVEVLDEELEIVSIQQRILDRMIEKKGRKECVDTVFVWADASQVGWGTVVEEAFVPMVEHKDAQKSQGLFSKPLLKSPNTNLKELVAALEGIAFALRIFRPKIVMFYGDNHSAVEAMNRKKRTNEMYTDILQTLDTLLGINNTKLIPLLVSRKLQKADRYSRGTNL